MTHKYINNEHLNGVCTTAVGTAAKVVGISGFSALHIGTRISVLFTVGNTAATPTLAVNGTTAGQIWFNGAIIASGMIPANHTADLIWDGARWQLINPATGATVPYGQCTTAVGTAAKTTTLAPVITADMLISGLMIEVLFTVGNSSTSATLNPNGLGAIGIKSDGAVPVLVDIRAMYKCYFVYDGTFWQLLNPARGHFQGLRLNSLTTTAKTVIGAINELVNGLGAKQNSLNRTVVGNDNATASVTDTGGNLSISVPVTTTAPAASTTQATAATRSLRALAQILVNNIAQLFSAITPTGLNVPLSSGLTPLNNFVYFKQGNVVTVVGAIQDSGNNINNGSTIATLPTGYRPALIPVDISIAVDTGTGAPQRFTGVAMGRINPNGTITISTLPSNTLGIAYRFAYISISFIAA